MRSRGRGDERRDERRARERVIVNAFRSFPNFCQLLDIITKDVSSGNPRRPFKWRRIQRLFWKEIQKTGSRRAIILKARQIGMTTFLLALDLWFFLTVRGARVVVVTASDTENKYRKLIAEPLRVFIEALRRAEVPLDGLEEHAFEWYLPQFNSSLRIVGAGASEASAAKGSRGAPVTHLHCTELAFWEYAADTLTAMLASVPTVEQGSWVVFESTPNGASGTFYDRCQAARAGLSGYSFHFYPWFEHEDYRTKLDPGEVVEPSVDSPREMWLADIAKVPPERLKWFKQQVANSSTNETDQEFPSDPDTCFLASGRMFFELAIVRALQLVAQKTKPISIEFGGVFRVWAKPRKGMAATRVTPGIPTPRYIIGADVAEGIDVSDQERKNDPDYSTAVVLDRETGAHVASYRARVSPEDFAVVLDSIGRVYNNALIAVERNNHGHTVLLGLKTLHYPNVYEHMDGHKGWLTTPVTRPLMLDDMAGAIKSGLLKTPDTIMLDEMTTFIIYPNGKPSHRAGRHDDLIMGMAIAWYVRALPMAARGNFDIPGYS